MQENWLPITNTNLDYTGLYEISSLGRIKSLPKSWAVGNGTRTKLETFLKPGADPYGYLSVVLCKDKIRKTFKVHLLVWDHFGDQSRKDGDHKVDHVNADKNDCSINNLQLLSHRNNCIKRDQQNGKELPPGVSVSSNKKNFRSRIIVDGKEKHLGTFDNPVSAAKAYSEAHKNLSAVKGE